MMLKKQTVWLLTMLSLVVVLSVYYVTSPDGGSNNGIVMTENEQETTDEDVDTTPAEENGKEEAGEEEKPAKDGEDAKQPEEDAKEGEVKTEELGDGTDVSSISSDELFATLRMELEDARNQRTEQLEAIVANTDIQATEKNEAYEEMEELAEAASKERVLETLIKAKGYDDALVRADGNEVKITVKAKELSATAANEIIATVRSEIGNMEDVAVTFQPTE